MLTLENVREAELEDARLRWRFPQLTAPVVLPWSELPVLGLDDATPWLYGPVERDPLVTRGRAAVPRRELRRLRTAVTWGVPFQRVAFAHELDPAGAVHDLLPELENGPRTCTDSVAGAVVGPQPVHPAVRGVARVLDAALSRRTLTAVSGTLAAALDPIIFGVIGMPDTEPGRIALFYPLTAWKW